MMVNGKGKGEEEKRRATWLSNVDQGRVRGGNLHLEFYAEGANEAKGEKKKIKMTVSQRTWG